MKREIKFRGLGTVHNIWFYGCLFRDMNNTPYILDAAFVPAISMPSESFVEVKAETIGQFTGLRDKNEVEIFEGDILLIEGIEGYTAVYWDDKMASFRIKTKLKHYYDGSGVTFGFEEVESEEIQILGNIHQKPELIK